MSRLLGTNERESNTGNTPNITKTGKQNVVSQKEKEKKIDGTSPSAHSDIRAKCAGKLWAKVEGGLAGVELAKSKKDESLQQGDAASHLAARNIALMEDAQISGSRWMANSGTGSLLSFLSMRSMKIALMPPPQQLDPPQISKKMMEMEDITRQLPDVRFDLLLEGEKSNEDKDGENTATNLLKKVSTGVKTDPIAILVVSDRDDYLRHARDMGMFTCRVRRRNAPRGNVTTNYTAQNISDVQDVVNELNGISFNTVFLTS